MDLIELLKSSNNICYYPSSGIDLSDIDYFASGKLSYFIRKNNSNFNLKQIDFLNFIDESYLPPSMPDLFIHTDLNFYREFEDGFENDKLTDYGINGSFEILSYKEIQPLSVSNEIYQNFMHSGRCFLYKLKVWNNEAKLLICIIENETFVAKILLKNNIKIPIIWTKDWNGSKTYGTWLINVFKRLNTTFFYSDWLCLPSKNLGIENKIVFEKYPELEKKDLVKLVKNTELCFIDESKHGWVQEYIIVK